MAESELKLDVACPRCGTSNMPAAHKCRQCFQDLAAVAPAIPDNAPAPGLFDFPRAALTCPACGKTSAFSLDTCVECGAAMAGGRAPTPEQAIAPTRLRKAVRARRKHVGAAGSPSIFNLTWLLRLGAVLFLFWGVIDTSFWLDKVNRGPAPEDTTVMRYSLFAIYEIVRDAAIAGGVWLLTLLKPRR
jgi:hypothetical protein